MVVEGKFSVQLRPKLNKSVQLGKDFGLDFALERGQILICGEVKQTHSPWPRV